MLSAVETPGSGRVPLALVQASRQQRSAWTRVTAGTELGGEEVACPTGKGRRRNREATGGRRESRKGNRKREKADSLFVVCHELEALPHAGFSQRREAEPRAPAPTAPAALVAVRRLGWIVECSDVSAPGFTGGGAREPCGGGAPRLKGWNDFADVVADEAEARASCVLLNDCSQEGAHQRMGVPLRCAPSQFCGPDTHSPTGSYGYARRARHVTHLAAERIVHPLSLHRTRPESPA